MSPTILSSSDGRGRVAERAQQIVAAHVSVSSTGSSLSVELRHLLAEHFADRRAVGREILERDARIERRQIVPEVVGPVLLGVLNKSDAAPSGATRPAVGTRSSATATSISSGVERRIEIDATSSRRARCTATE